jgi:uncharacterized membrane-anchored protein
MRLTARQRALPGIINENNKRLAAIGEITEGDWSAIDEACSWLAQNLRADCQPDWDAHPLATRRFDRLKYRREGWSYRREGRSR